tara:strand:+ start:1344 stop:2534 length:1191 start_codon:yes stop_codon:yes gene_type:complete
MALKRFEPKDLIYNTIVAKPEYSIIVNNTKVYLQKEKEQEGDFNNKIKHVNSGELSLYELNINRPDDSLIYSFIQKDSTRYAAKSVSTSDFDDISQFAYGDTLIREYPLKSKLSRIYIPAGIQFNSPVELDPPHANKKYITALESVINTQGDFSYGLEFGDLGTSEVNIISIPGIFYGSSVDRGSVKLRVSIAGAKIAEACDIHKNGKLIQTVGPTTGNVVGYVLYNQGLIILNDSNSLDQNYVDKYMSATITSQPTWISFGTGLPQVGEELEHGPVEETAYSINFKAVNKIPTLTMYAYAKASEMNYSSNPTFLEETDDVLHTFSDSKFIQTKRKIKKINKSVYYDHEEEFENTTYISKVGIYDKDRNLIAIATLANPIKKTEKREFMIKMGIDF